MAKRLYIQLYCARTGESITLPINPEDVEITNEKEVQSYNILNYGEVSVRSGKKLKHITLANVLPKETNYFALLASLIKQLDYKPYNQQETVDMINRWVDDDEIIRLIISQHLNTEFTIESYVNTVRETTDILKYSINLVEYKNPSRNVQPYKKEDSKLVKLVKRKINKYIPSQLTGQAGQTIYKIAKLTYGDKWIELRDKNHLTDANLDMAGKIVEMLPL